NRFVGYVFDFSKFQHANTIRKTIAYVRANYARRVTLTEAAKEVWMSPSHLSTVFSAEMGMGFSEYVREFRIEKAKELLLGNTPIAEVAAATGFSDQSYFTKVFTKQAGVSPAQFRRQAGGGRR
ncbi:MAG: AraC family transcriptional regulator, partial [Propionibacteriaceae bacterium]|nr:AraC family transcriptional regulator [Propionibacteriaceae bacterium]